MLALFIYKLIPEWSEFYAVLFAAYPISVFALFASLYRKGTRIGRMKDLLAERERMRREREQMRQESSALASKPTP